MAVSNAVSAGAVARVVGIETIFKDLRGSDIFLLPQRVAIVGQGSSAVTYATTKQQITSSSQAGSIYGFGSPIHLTAAKLLPVNGDGVGTIPVTVYPLEDDGSGVASAGDITPSGTVTKAGAFRVVVNNIISEEFVVALADTPALIIDKMVIAVNAVIGMPVIATDGTTVLDVDAKWAGVSSNDIFLEVTGPTDTGVSFAINQVTGGLVNPDVDDALALFGDVWETMVLSCIDVADTVNLDRYQTFGEGRWGALVKKPLMVFSGETEVDATTASTLTDARKDDRVNVQLVAPGSNDLPFAVAARELARIVVRANENPAFDYGSLDADGLTPGTDGEQWNYIERDFVVKRGSSTIEVKDGVVNISDTVTMYHPTGEEPPAYRYVVDIVKLQNMLFNVALIFESDEWNGAPLIPDDQATVNPDAKQPKMARAALSALASSLALQAIISDPQFMKDSIIAQISTQNPKRLDLAYTAKISGNTNIISIDQNWGFLFGTPTIIA